ncbi:substrate-binding periplasmic protein [Megalodesulfovibrio paquesii]
MSRLLVCLALATGLLAMCAPARAGESLTFYADQLYPFCYEQNNQVVGEAVEAVRQLCRRAGCEPKFVIAPWPWVLETVRQGRGDAVFTALKTPDREQYLEYTEQPLGVTRNRLLGCNKAAPTVEQLEDLTGRIVGVVKDFAYSPHFSTSPLFARDESPNVATMLRKCLGGRLDYAVVNLRMLPHLQEQHPEAARLPIQPMVVNESPYYIAFSKARGAKSQHWRSAISRAVRELRAEGILPPLQP